MSNTFVTVLINLFLRLVNKIGYNILLDQVRMLTDKFKF